MSELVIRYESDPNDEVGRLWLELKAESFSGTAFFWSNLTELPSIIAKLRCYPLGDPAKWTWGYNDIEGADIVLALAIAQDGHAGQLMVTVEMADLYDLSRRLTTKLQTDYNALDELRAGLELMVAQRAGQASLPAH